MVLTKQFSSEGLNKCCATSVSAANIFLWPYLLILSSQKGKAANASQENAFLANYSWNHESMVSAYLLETLQSGRPDVAVENLVKYILKSSFSDDTDYICDNIYYWILIVPQRIKNATSYSLCFFQRAFPTTFTFVWKQTGPIMSLGQLHHFLGKILTPVEVPVRLQLSCHMGTIPIRTRQASPCQSCNCRPSATERS